MGKPTRFAPPSPAAAHAPSGPGRGTPARAARLLGLLAATAGTLGSCGGAGETRSGRDGAPPSPSVSGELIPAALVVTSSTPEDAALQVPVDASIRVALDGVLLESTLRSAETWLRRGGPTGDDVPGTVALGADGASVVFRPQAPLAEATTYVFQLSPATSALDGRLLEAPHRVVFTTLDAEAPRVLSASVAPGATGVDRDGTIVLTMSEPVVLPAAAPSTAVTLTDVFDLDHPVEATVVGDELRVRPVASLVGDRRYTLRLADGLTDRVGNAHEDGWSVTFTAAPDGTPPAFAAGFPAGRIGMSPEIHPALTFSESVDPASVEAASVAFTDSFGNIVPYSVAASDDRKTLRLVPSSPLQAGRLYLINLAGGAGAVTDQAGNTLAAATGFSFATGSDTTPPTVVDTTPSDGAVDVSITAAPLARFSEELDAATVGARTVTLTTADGTPVAAAVRTEQSGTAIRVVPDDELPSGGEYVLTILGGEDGVRDAAGNPLAADLEATFRTSALGAVPTVLLQPYDGAVTVPRGARVSATFSVPIDPATVTADSFRVTDALDVPVQGTRTVSRADRVVHFEPSGDWAANSNYKITVIGGPRGVKTRDTGTPLATDATAEFTTGSGSDLRAPTLEVTLNGIDASRSADLTVPPFGFTVDVRAQDLVDFSLDSGTFELEFDGPGGGPAGDATFATAIVDGSSMQWKLPLDLRLSAGSWTVTAVISDLSGNVGRSTPFAFRVDEPTPDATPFERTQTVWVRADLDRDGSGRPDFEEDLERLGLISASDPAGTNARMVDLVLDGILAHAHHLFGRDAEGRRLAEQAVPLWLTAEDPRGAPSMMMALGGFDPAGAPGRVYGDDSSGTLGRAFFDYRNAYPGEHNVTTSPGVGVFPSELFLFEAKVHLQLFPSFTTTFASRFLALCPEMGGTPVGTDPRDAAVLDPDFDPSTASASQVARYNAILRAADDWAVAVGTILAHEVGHAIGLVANGPNPAGLHGDSSLHNRFSSTTDVMSAAVGYDALVSLDYRFRDLNHAYLQHRVLMK